MIFQSSFRKEFSSAAGATFVALFSIVVTSGLVRTLGQAAGGKIDDSEVFSIILLGALKYLPATLVITVFISVMGVVSRNYRESEMTAWMASGISLKKMLSPTLRFALPLTLLALLCSLFLTPWANQQMQLAKERFSQRSDVSKMSAGQFRESTDGSRVFFIERQNEATGEVDNVFVIDRAGRDRTVLVAESGRIEPDSQGQRYLVLNNGSRYGLTDQGQEITFGEFEKYGLAIYTNLTVTPNLETKYLPLHLLLLDSSPAAMAELLWRVSLPLSALMLAVLALPLGFVNPRGGRSLNHIFALLIYFTYSNVISISQSAVTKGDLPFSVALVMPHLVVILLAMYLAFLRGRPQGMGLIGTLRRRRGVQA